MNLYPVHDRILQRSDKEKLLGQKGRVIWLYGLSGSGKSTIAIALERKLYAQGLLTQILDGDNIRSGLNHNLGFSDEDRRENIRRVAEVARLYCHSGLITITSLICPQRKLRQLARDIIGPEDFIEVFVKASYETCSRRDPKGLYEKVAAGEVQQFTGRDSAFEEPVATDEAIVLDTERNDLETCVKQLCNAAF